MENYTQVKILGKGAFGSAWLVQRKADKAQFVAKEVRLAGMKPAERESAKHEISMLRQLNHPNVTRYVDHFESRGSLFIVMEYANGGDLYTKIKSRNGRRFTEKEILNYFGQLCLALLHLHDKRILHRDLKSQNVFLTSDGVVKLGDFGISTVLRNTYELKRTVCGTPYYFSPELCMNKPYNNKSDVWALGCILYELTTLNHAFDGNSMKALVQKILKGVYPPIHSSYSPDLAKLVASTLKIDPSQRPAVHQIVASPYIRAHLTEMKQVTEQANRDGRSIVNPAEQQHDKLEAQRRVEREAALKAQREGELKAMNAQREKQRQDRMEELRRQMELRQKEHEEQLRRIRERDAARQAEEAERRKAMEARAREQRRIQQERAAAQARIQKQREEEWERNMQNAIKRPDPSPDYGGGAGGGGGGYNPPPQPAQKPAYDQNDAARIYREMRREAEANRMRALQDADPAKYARMQQQQQQGGHQAPPAPPQHQYRPQEDRDRDPPRKKPMSDAELEEARKQAFWQMRREAEENKRRLLGLDPLPPPQQATPPAQQQAPPPQNRSPPPQNRSPPKRTSPVQPRSPLPVQQKEQQPQQAPRSPPPPLQSPHSPPPPANVPTAAPRKSTPASPMSPAEDITDEDEDVGYHKFLNNEAVASETPAAAAEKRAGEYDAMQQAIQDALNDNTKHEDFEDAGDNDPTKFVLDGQTLHLPNCHANHPLMSRIESLRLFLDHSLGEEVFIKAYRIMDNISGEEDEDSLRMVEKLLPPDQHRYIPVIAQLIVCEEYFNEKGNAA